MSAMPRQLTLDLAHRAALGAEDFLVSRSNAAAVDFIDRWPDWEHPSAIVVGPPRAGKTHLGNVWRLRSGASTLPAEHLDEQAVGLLKQHRALLIEDVDRGVRDEKALFHLLNLAREERSTVLLTSAKAPGELDITLPDLRSRLRALAVVTIAPPDEDLLRAVLVKLFADRQLAVEPHIIAQLERHMERSMAFATRLVEEIDRQALSEKRRITRTLAMEILSRLSGERDDETG